MNLRYTVDPESKDRQVVGKIDVDNIYRLIGICFSEEASEIYLYPGAIKHVKRRHPGIFESYHHQIPEMISNPDYIGKNPTEPNSIELYKKVDDDLLLAIKLDPSGYLFIASFYKLHNANNKINKRLRSGRVVVYSALA